MQISLILLPFVILAIIILLANLALYHEVFRWLVLVALVGINLTLVLVGMLGRALPATATPGLSPALVDANVSFLNSMLITGVVAFLPLLPPVRRLISRVLPIDPASPVHTTALVYAVYLLGLGIGQQPLLSNPEALEGLGDLEITSSLIWAQALGMILLTFAGMGTGFRRSWRDTMSRLGVERLTLRHLLLAAGTVLGLIAMQVVAVLLWNAVDPEGLQRINEAGNLLLGNINGLAGALTIGLAAALGEELVFRGALQPRFLLLPTALLFTVIHSQYGFSPASLLILAIALVLGVLRSRTNLSVCILVHFSYNFISVLLPAVGQ